MRKNNRPVFLDLTKLKYPPMAIVSILHRLTGVLLFLAIPLMLWVLELSLRSAPDFYHLKYILSTPVFSFLIWLIVIVLFYHLIAGIRHLLMDTGIGDSLKAGRVGAYIVMALSVVFLILAGLWLW